MTFSRRLYLLAPLLLLVLFSGCVDTEDNAGVFRATYSWWVGALAMGGGLFGIFVGWMWKQSDFRGWLILIIALVATITYLPFGFIDHVTIDDERLTSQWGFWVYPTKHEVQWNDVKRVTLTKEVKRGRRGRKRISYNLNFSLNSGGTQHLSATNSLMEASAEHIVDHLHERGIEVIDQTGDY